MLAKDCKVRDGGQPRALSTDFKHEERCDSLEVAAGEVVLRYRHKRQWFVPPRPVPSGRKVAEVFALYAPDTCSVLTNTCIQQQMYSRAAMGGHGIDGQRSMPGGAGEPCARGLPCGRVLPPPAGAWSFTLADAAQDGQWVVRIARGTPPVGVPEEFGAPIRGGQVVADGNLFSPAATYTYRLLDSGGAQRASGEFSVLSRPLAQAVRTMADNRKAAGATEFNAWFDTLAASELDWDAHQFMLKGR